MYFTRDRASLQHVYLSSRNQHEILPGEELYFEKSTKREHPAWNLLVIQVLETGPAGSQIITTSGVDKRLQIGDIFVISVDKGATFIACEAGRLRLEVLELEVELPADDWLHPSEWPLIRQSGQIPILAALLSYICERFETNDPSRSELAGESVNLFLKIFINDTRLPEGVTPAEEAYPDKLQRAIEIISAQAERVHSPPLSVPKLAREVELSTQHLYGLFNRYVGKGPAECLRRLRIRRACALLLSGKTPIKEIATQSGYPDPYQFSRVFKKEVGVSPRKFRNMKEFALPRHPFQVATDNDRTLACLDVIPKETGPITSPELLKDRLIELEKENAVHFPLVEKAAASRFVSLNLRKDANRYRNAKWESLFGYGLRLFHLPKSKATYHGIPFKFLRESVDRGEHGIIIMDSETPHLKASERPREVSYSLEGRFDAFYLLVLAGWAEMGKQVATVTACADGQAKAKQKLFTHDARNKGSKASPNRVLIQDWWPYFPQVNSTSSKKVIVLNQRNKLFGARFLYVVECKLKTPSSHIAELTITAEENTHSTLGILAISALKSH